MESSTKVRNIAQDEKYLLRKAIEKKIVELKQNRETSPPHYRKARNAFIQYINDVLCENCLVYDLYLNSLEIIVLDIRELFPRKARAFLDSCLSSRDANVNFLICKSMHCM